MYFSSSDILQKALFSHSALGKKKNEGASQLCNKIPMEVKEVPWCSVTVVHWLLDRSGGGAVVHHNLFFKLGAECYRAF